MEKSTLIKIGKGVTIFLALVGLVQLILGLIEFFTGSNPICG